MVLWTAPCGGTATVSATFGGINDTTTDVHVLLNGQRLFSSQINGRADTVSAYFPQLRLAHGDQLGVLVGCGSNVTNRADATTIAFTMRLTPP